MPASPPLLHPLAPEHRARVLEFERRDRAHFATMVSDRGDTYFAKFDQRYADLLAAQAAGAGAFYLVLGEDGNVEARVNLTIGEDGTAVLGYRVARRATGRDLATAAVRVVCRIAAERGLTLVRAAVAHSNPASARVLTKADFTPTGPADPAEMGGKRGTAYEWVPS